MKVDYRSIGPSVFVHLLVFAALLRSEIIAPSPKSKSILVLEIADFASPRSTRRSSLGIAQPSKGIDLRPNFMKNGVLFATGSTGEQGNETPKSESERQSSELLNVNPKVTTAFDNLAAQINHFLDYPSILTENGIQGTASLDLYFDAAGEIDETKSKFLGGHRSLRGLLVQASRKGLAIWCRSDGARLDMDQFKNQHFRADFSISYGNSDASKVEKEGEGAYRLVRRHFVSVCANPMGLDLTCLVLKGYGAARRILTDDYKIKLAALQDVLDHFDEIGLQGMRALVRGG